LGKTIWLAMTMAALPLAGVSAQDMASPPAAACPATPAPLPAALAGWSSRTPLAAAAEPAKIDAATLVPGQAVDATLVSTADVHYAQRPEKPGGSVSYGGMFGFTVTDKGLYRVALGSGAWIDMLQDGKPLPSAAHGHGPDCSGIRKMVDFTLEPGRYVLQIAANGSRALPILLTRLP
jgi:hypothetical protein